jgi:hypothetical protein
MNDILQGVPGDKDQVGTIAYPNSATIAASGYDLNDLCSADCTVAIAS